MSELSDLITDIDQQVDTLLAENAALREQVRELREFAQWITEVEDREWKPMRVFRSEEQVDRDEARHALAQELADEARQALAHTAPAIPTGTWQGDDFEARLQEVYDSRTDVAHTAPVGEGAGAGLFESMGLPGPKFPSAAGEGER